jgi:hypothetical protein
MSDPSLVVNQPSFQVSYALQYGVFQHERGVNTAIFAFSTLRVGIGVVKICDLRSTAWV